MIYEHPHIPVRAGRQQALKTDSQRGLQDGTSNAREDIGLEVLRDAAGSVRSLLRVRRRALVNLPADCLQPPAFPQRPDSLSAYFPEQPLTRPRQAAGG